MSYHTYEQVARLDTDTQRQLLQHGDAVERVWAAWALGVTLGTQSTPDLLVSLHESPTAGTRRHLLVVLAGLGERGVLRIFAQDDPDDYVRATACQYLIRIGQHTDSSTSQFLRERLLHDPSPIVRQAILGEAPVAFPALQFEDLTELAQDPDLEVRQAVTERLLAIVPLDRLFPGVLEDRIRHEGDVALRQHLLALCLRAGGSARLLALSISLARDRSLEILRLLVDAKEQFSWEQLAPLSAAHEPQRDALLVQLLQPASTISAVSWVLDGMARAATWPKPHNRPEAELADAVRSYAWHATQLLIAARPQLLTIDRVALDPASMQIVTAYLQEEIAQLEWEWEHDEWEEKAEWYEQAIHERRALVSALTHMDIIG